MDNDDKRIGLTIIDGGKDAPDDDVTVERQAGRTACNEYGLTVKQEAYARGLSEGLSNAEAYRRAYQPSATAKPSSIHEIASKIAAKDKVKARVAVLVKAKAEKTSLLGARTSDRIMSAIWKMAESSETPAAAKVSALTLAAKMSGLLTDKVEVKSVPDKPAEIEQELRDRLAKFSKSL